MNVVNPNERDEEGAEDQEIGDSDNSSQRAQKSQDEVRSQEEGVSTNPIIINK
ncbi:MAG: hypothetical protein ABIP11_07195 [Luteimonas sp.]